MIAIRHVERGEIGERSDCIATLCGMAAVKGGSMERGTLTEKLLEERWIPKSRRFQLKNTQPRTRSNSFSFCGIQQTVWAVFSMKGDTALIFISSTLVLFLLQPFIFALIPRGPKSDSEHFFCVCQKKTLFCFCHLSRASAWVVPAHKQMISSHRSPCGCTVRRLMPYQRV